MIHLTTRVHLFTSPRNICSLRQTVLHKAQRRILQKARTFSHVSQLTPLPPDNPWYLVPFRNDSISFYQKVRDKFSTTIHQAWSLLLKQINLSLMSLHFRVSKQLVSPWEAGNLRAAIQKWRPCMHSSTPLGLLEQGRELPMTSGGNSPSSNDCSK